MSDKQFNVLIGVGAVCVVAIVAIAGCVKHIVSTVCGMEDDPGLDGLDGILDHGCGEDAGIGHLD